MGNLLSITLYIGIVQTINERTFGSPIIRWSNVRSVLVIKSFVICSNTRIFNHIERNVVLCLKMTENGFLSLTKKNLRSMNSA